MHGINWNPTDTTLRRKTAHHRFNRAALFLRKRLTLWFVIDQDSRTCRDVEPRGHVFAVQLHAITGDETIACLRGPAVEQDSTRGNPALDLTARTEAVSGKDFMKAMG